MKANEPCTKSATTETSGYSYDGAGNETAITGYSDPASTAFSYNNLSQLKGLTPPSVAEQTATYLGSGQNDLTGLGSISLQNSLLGITKQTNESGMSYYARTASGTMLDERLPGSTSYNPIYDSRGDTIGLLNTSGALVQTIRYSPYGDWTTSEGSLAYSPTNDPFLFQGGYHIPGGNAGLGNVSPGLYHYGERYYDPTTGRWTQQDPIPRGDRFLFAGADPINNIDPNGESAEEYGEKCLEGAGTGAVEGWAGAAKGCATGLVSQGFREAGCDECSEAVDYAGKVTDVYKIGKKAFTRGFKESTKLVGELLE